MTDGTAQLNVALDTAGTVTLTASAGALQATSSAIAVSPAAATAFTVTAPSTAAAYAAFTVTLTAIDPYGNVVTGYSGPVNLTSSDGQLGTVTLATLTWTNGTAVATVTLDTPNVVTLTATAGNASGTSGSLVVEPTASGAVSYGLAAL